MESFANISKNLTNFQAKATTYIEALWIKSIVDIATIIIQISQHFATLIGAKVANIIFFHLFQKKSHQVRGHFVSEHFEPSSTMKPQNKR